MGLVGEDKKIDKHKPGKLDRAKLYSSTYLNDFLCVFGLYLLLYFVPLFMLCYVMFKILAIVNLTPPSIQSVVNLFY